MPFTLSTLVFGLGLLLPERQHTVFANAWLPEPATVHSASFYQIRTALLLEFTCIFVRATFASLAARLGGAS